jgi:hypothetical protein
MTESTYTTTYKTTLATTWTKMFGHLHDGGNLRWRQEGLHSPAKLGEGDPRLPGSSRRHNHHYLDDKTVRMHWLFLNSKE